MTKADIVSDISKMTSLGKTEVTSTLEALFVIIKKSMADGENIYIRGFGTFHNKKKAQKIGRIITRGTSMVIPEHYAPKFKPAREFKEKVKAGMMVEKE